MINQNHQLSAQAKDQLLRQLRAAVFYQVGLWKTASSIEDTLSECQEGNWDAILRLAQVRSEFGEKIVDNHDVERFTAGFDQTFRAVLEERYKSALRQKLQKALWIQNQLWETAALMAQTLAESTDDVIWGVQELSISADSGCELVESDLDFFLGAAPPGTIKQGQPLYL
jgi:hypothetical protein